MVATRDGLVVLDQTVGDADGSMGVGCHVRVVCHQDDSDALGIELLKHPQDFHARVRIEVAGRLVGQQQGGVVDQCPGDRHALLLSAGHLRRLVVGPFGQPDQLQEGLGPAAAIPRRRGGAGRRTRA